MSLSLEKKIALLPEGYKHQVITKEQHPALNDEQVSFHNERLVYQITLVDADYRKALRSKPSNLRSMLKCLPSVGTDTPPNYRP